jgi:uncharacterized Fe-S center protein
VYPAAGPQEQYVYLHERPFKNIQQWQVAGMIQDASFLVNFAHVKGLPSCGFGAAFKNLALGCMAGPTRGSMHDAMQFDPYWFPDLCPDEGVRQRILAACPFEALVQDQQDPRGIHLHPSSAMPAGAASRWPRPAA